MHPLFTLEQTVPCDPGTSPFQVRGVIYSRAIEHAVSIAGSAKEFARGLPDARVAAFMLQPFQFTALYDALPLTPVQVRLSELQGRDFEEATRERAADGAVRLIPTMFRLIMAFGRPRAWALHAPRLMSEYCGVGGLRTVAAGDQQAMFEARGVPQFIAASHVNTLIGIFEGTLSVLRARSVKSRYFDVMRDGEAAGHPLCSYQLEITWS